MTLIILTIFAVLSAVPTFLFCVTFVRLFAAPSEVWKLNGAAFLFCLPAAFFILQATLERAENSPTPTNEGMAGLVMYGFPGLAVAFVLYVLARRKLRDGWWNEIVAAVVAGVSIFYLPQVMI
jgi:hypothetical protein